MTNTLFTQCAALGRRGMRISPIAVLNGLGIVLAAIGAGFGGGGLWVFVVVAAIFSVRGLFGQNAKRQNAPAAACVLLVPILISDLDSVPLGLLWAAYVLIATLPFRIQVASGIGTSDRLKEWQRVSLWTIWGENSRTRLRREDEMELMTMGTMESAHLLRR